MSLFENVKNYLSGGTPKVETPEEYCPNCWGRQEYEGQFLKAIEKESIDLNNVNEKKGWIQAYAVEHFEGIKGKAKNDVLECNSCKVTYQPA